MRQPDHDRDGLVSLAWDLLDETVAKLQDPDIEDRATWTLRTERQIDLLDRMLGRAEIRNSPAAAPSGTDAFDALVAGLDDG